MGDEEKAEIRKQLIILGFAIATLLIFTVGQRYLSSPDLTEQLRMRAQTLVRKANLYEREAMRQVQKEISMMEHGDGS